MLIVSLDSLKRPGEKLIGLEASLEICISEAFNHSLFVGKLIVEQPRLGALAHFFVENFKGKGINIINIAIF
jgi:hypothetical protein